MKKLFFIALPILFSHFGNAQSFNYTFSQSSGTFSSLTGGTTVASGSQWNSRGYKVPVGFSFTMQGKNYDTVIVAPNGFILFGNDNSRAIATFKGITAQSNSTISYLSGGGILKIEFANVGFGSSASDNFNFQVWLIQSGNLIEFHTGSTNLNTAQDSLIMPIAGVINPSMDKNTNGYLITGNPSSAQAQSLGTGNLSYMIRVPDPNTVYKLTPQ